MLMHVDVASDEDGDALVHRRVLADLMRDALRGRQRPSVAIRRVLADLMMDALRGRHEVITGHSHPEEDGEAAVNDEDSMVIEVRAWNVSSCHQLELDALTLVDT